MEPFITAAIAIGSLVATKALEKTGEKVGEALLDRTSNLLSSLRKESPNTVAAIELVPDTPLNYVDAVLELKAAAQNNPQVKENTEALVDAVEPKNLPDLEPILKKIVEALKSNKDISETNNFEQVVNFAKGSIKIESQTNIEHQHNIGTQNNIESQNNIGTQNNTENQTNIEHQTINHYK